MNCSVCLESFTAALKRPVECPYCAAKACLQCAKQCAIMWAAAPKCSSCNKAFTADTLEGMFPKSFRRGDLRKAFIENLQEQETSLLPATMERLAFKRREAECYAVSQEIAFAINDFQSRPMSSVQALSEKLTELQGRLIAAGYSEISRSPQARKAEAVRKSLKCPREACNGFIFTSGPGANSCGLCSAKVCPDCNATLLDSAAVDTHRASGCNPDDVASWTSIKADTVGCPKCGTRIQKVSGCNQMWCTVAGCQTAFDWATGRVINGPIHNPHYHEFLRINGAVAQAAIQDADLACQGPRDIVTYERIAFVSRCIDHSLRRDDSPAFEGLPGAQGRKQWNLLVKLVDSSFRVILESLDPYVCRMARLQDQLYGPQLYEGLRESFLTGSIDKKEWAAQLSHKETLRVKKQRVATLHRMFQTAAADLFLRLYTEVGAKLQQTEPPTSIIMRNYYAPPLAHTRYYIPRRQDTGPDVRQLLPQYALPILTAYLTGLEALRVYYAKELEKIIQDYSDKSVDILMCGDVEGPHGGFYWARMSTAELAHAAITKPIPFLAA